MAAFQTLIGVGPLSFRALLVALGEELLLPIKHVVHVRLRDHLSAWESLRALWHRPDHSDFFGFISIYALGHVWPSHGLQFPDWLGALCAHASSGIRRLLCAGVLVVLDDHLVRSRWREVRHLASLGPQALHQVMLSVHLEEQRVVVWLVLEAWYDLWIQLHHALLVQYWHDLGGPEARRAPGIVVHTQIGR